MALKATLKVGGTDYELVDYKWKMTCPHNETRPDGLTRCDCLEFTVISPGKNDLTLLDWYILQSGQSGDIKVQMDDTQKTPFKTVHFENALCYAIEETYHIDKYARRALRLNIAVESLKVDDVIFSADL